VFAESQTKGRGRLGRKWISPPVAVFVLIRCGPICVPGSTQLTVAAAMAFGGHPRRDRIECRDQMAQRHSAAREKSAGILTEMSAELDRVKHVIIGVGWT